MKKAVNKKRKTRKRVSLINVDNMADLDIILEKNKIIQDVLGFSSDDLYGLFQQALAYLKANAYEEAEKGFKFLCQINAYVPEFWQGLGLAREAQGKYQEAFNAFSMCIALDPNFADGYLHAFECSLESNNPLQAHTILMQAKKIAKKNYKNMPSEFDHIISEMEYDYIHAIK